MSRFAELAVKSRCPEGLTPDSPDDCWHSNFESSRYGARRCSTHGRLAGWRLAGRPDAHWRRCRQSEAYTLREHIGLVRDAVIARNKTSAAMDAKSRLGSW